VLGRGRTKSCSEVDKFPKWSWTVKSYTSCPHSPLHSTCIVVQSPPLPFFVDVIAIQPPQTRTVGLQARQRF
jgi:hypothetical protein